MKKIFFLLIIFINIMSRVLLAEDSVSMTTYFPAQVGDYDNVRTNYMENYNVISNSLDFESTNSFDFVNVNRGVRVFGSCVGDYANTAGVDANTVDLNSLDYIEIDSVDADIFFKQNSQIRITDNTHRILFRSSENKLELREYGDIVFSSGAVSGDETATMVLQANGNVGIGTSTPDANLEIATVDNITSGMSNTGIFRITDNTSQLDFVDTNGQDWAIVVDNDKMSFVREPWNNQGLVLDGSGKVGIGTDTPAYDLDINGTLNAGNIILEDGGILIPGLEVLEGDKWLIIGNLGSTAPSRTSTFGCNITQDWPSGSNYNLAFGSHAMDSDQKIYKSVAVGYKAFSNAGIYQSVAMGSRAGEGVQGGSFDFSGKTPRGVFIGYRAGEGAAHNAICIGYKVGRYSPANTINIGNSVAELIVATHTEPTKPTGEDADASSTVAIKGVIFKEWGQFRITHPDPVKAEQGWQLQHSFVEGPTAGDNIYRFKVNVKGKQAEVKLPDYYKFLNESTQVWVSPVKHFGLGVGQINADQEKIIIKTDRGGVYNVLVIGTRKDETARRYWQKLGGVESKDTRLRRHKDTEMPEDPKTKEGV